MKQRDTKTSLVKVKQMDICSYQDAENLVLKQETDTIGLTQVDDNNQSKDQILDTYPDETVENCVLNTQTINSVVTQATPSNVSDHSSITPYLETAGAKKNLFKVKPVEKAPSVSHIFRST